MRKRRRNITIVNNEIDYDKLANAIVEAQEIKAKRDKENFKSKKLSILSRVFCIGLGIAAAFLVLVGIYSLIEISIFSGLKILLVSALLVVLVFAINITDRTTDKNYSINIVAVILALVSIIFDVIQKT